MCMDYLLGAPWRVMREMRWTRSVQVRDTDGREIEGFSYIQLQRDAIL